jgi:hypothetical protein
MITQVDRLKVEDRRVGGKSLIESRGTPAVSLRGYLIPNPCLPGRPVRRSYSEDVSSSKRRLDP